MAVTADIVEVRLQADVNKYLSDLNKAGSGFDRLTQKMNADVRSSGLAFSDLRVQASTAVAATQAQVNNFNTGNIAAQFQDIGVTAAAGMNPLIIALQQGTQLSAVLNAEIGKGVNPVRALGGAFLQVINPISLATIAAVALGAALLQSLGNVLPQTENANQALKRHRDELEKIVAGYGDAEDAINEYFDAASRRAPGIAAFQTRGEFEEIGREVDAFQARVAELSRTYIGFGEVGSTAERSIVRLTGEFAAGTISAEEFYFGLEQAKDELDALERVSAALPGSVAGMIASLQEGAEKAIAFGNAVNNLVSASMALSGLSIDSDLQNALDLRGYIAEQERLNGLTSEQLALEAEIARQKSNAGELGLTDEKALELAQAALAADKARADLKKDNSASGKAATEYERERKAVTDLLEAMGLEAALLGQTNREKAIAIALSKANATATEEELAAISQTAGFIYDTEQAVKKLNETSTEWANTIQSATRGFINDLIEGKSAAEAFSNVLSSIANKLLDVGLDNLFGKGGFNLAGLFGGTSTAATGGPVYAGNPTLVGEKGPEIFVPSGPGRIVPNSQIGGGGGVTFAPVIDARGADVAAVARLERVVQDMAANVVPAIRKEMATAHKKGR